MKRNVETNKDREKYFGKPKERRKRENPPNPPSPPLFPPTPLSPHSLSSSLPLQHFLSSSFSYHSSSSSTSSRFVSLFNLKAFSLLRLTNGRLRSFVEVSEEIFIGFALQMKSFFLLHYPTVSRYVIPYI